MIVILIPMGLDLSLMLSVVCAVSLREFRDLQPRMHMRRQSNTSKERNRFPKAQLSCSFDEHHRTLQPSAMPIRRQSRRHETEVEDPADQRALA